MDLDDLGHSDNARDGRDVADEIEVELVVERLIDRICRSDPKERVAVCRRAHDGLGGDIAARPSSALNHEWLAEPLRQPLTYQARGYVGRACRRKAND